MGARPILSPPSDGDAQPIAASRLEVPDIRGHSPYPAPVESPRASAPPDDYSTAKNVSQFLNRLNLSGYTDRFIAEGFDNLQSVYEMTEEDFAALDVKRGHRRTLQLEFARIRGYTTNVPLYFLNSPPDEGASKESPSSSNLSMPPSQRSTRSSASATATATADATSQARPQPTPLPRPPPAEPTGKRRYRRHPKSDPTAPDKPPSAYVAFSSAVREENKGKTFAELAKIVGERWKNLDEETRTAYEDAANKAKDDWTAKMAEYKRTDNYKQYQEYLLDFRERHPKQFSDKTSASDKASSSASNDKQTSTEQISDSHSPMPPDTSSEKRERSVSPALLSTGPKRLRTGSQAANDGPLESLFGASEFLSQPESRWEDRFYPRSVPTPTDERLYGVRHGSDAQQGSTPPASASKTEFSGLNQYLFRNKPEQHPSPSTSSDRSTLKKNR